MWDDLEKEIAIEKEMINRLLEGHRELLTKCQNTLPNNIEISALSAMLHSFYTGIENLFKRIAIYVDNNPPRGEAWHSQLLKSMAETTQNRPAVISESLRIQFQIYLNFRHVFRHAYTFELRWSKMAPLVLECKNTFQLLESQIDNFLKLDRLLRN